jgi:hypothetical protein
MCVFVGEYMQCSFQRNSATENVKAPKVRVAQQPWNRLLCCLINGPLNLCDDCMLQWGQDINIPFIVLYYRGIEMQ